MGRYQYEIKAPGTFIPNFVAENFWCTLGGKLTGRYHSPMRFNDEDFNPEIDTRIKFIVNDMSLFSFYGDNNDHLKIFSYLNSIGDGTIIISVYYNDTQIFPKPE